MMEVLAQTARMIHPFGHGIGRHRIDACSRSSARHSQFGGAAAVMQVFESIVSNERRVRD